jgi:hypothetical protein
VTAHDVIADALQQLGVLGVGQALSGEDADRGLVALNRLIGRWATHPQTQFVQTRTQYSLTSGDASYTIGSGGDFDQARPVNRDFLVSVIPDRTETDPLEIPLGRPLSIEEYQAIPQKTLSGAYPTKVFYDHNWSAGLGIITVFPEPESSTAALVLYTRTPLTVFADLTTDYTFPPGYEEAIEYNLAIRLAPLFEKTPSQWLVTNAREALADIKRANFRPAEARFPSTLVGSRGRYDIEGDR